MKKRKIMLKLTYHIIFITKNFHIPKSKKNTYIYINIYTYIYIKLRKNYKRKHNKQDI